MNKEIRKTLKKRAGLCKRSKYTEYEDPSVNINNFADSIVKFI